MTAGRIRDTMDLHEQYTAVKPDGSEPIILRVYVTRRSGVYGYQFAAVLWTPDGETFSSDRTTGCGYDKVSHACAVAIGAAVKDSGGEMYGEAYRLAESGRIEDALRHAFPEVFSAGAKLHRAHG